MFRSYPAWLFQDLTSALVNLSVSEPDLRRIEASEEDEEREQEKMEGEGCHGEGESEDEGWYSLSRTDLR